jgi:hypothetical protein
MAQDLDLRRESYDHLLLIAGKVAQANGPVDDTTDYNTKEGRTAWAIMANERSCNLAQARAEAARAVLVEILTWSPRGDMTESDTA